MSGRTLPRPMRLDQERRYFHTTPPTDAHGNTRAVIAAMELQGSAWPLYNPWEEHSARDLRAAAAILTSAAAAWDAIPGRSAEAGEARRAAARCIVKAGL